MKPKFGSVWAVFFGREGGTEHDSWHQEPVAVTFIQQIQIPHLCDLILDFFYLYTPVGFSWQVSRALPVDVQPLPELCVTAHECWAVHPQRC